MEILPSVYVISFAYSLLKGDAICLFSISVFCGSELELHHYGVGKGVVALEHPVGEGGGGAIAHGLEELTGRLVVDTDDDIELMEVNDAACVVVKGFERLFGIAFATMGLFNDNAYLGTTVSRVEVDEVGNAYGERRGLSGLDNEAQLPVGEDVVG